MTKTIPALFVRNIVFGVEDSLVSTVGLLSGIAVTGMPQSSIFNTGIILIFVEAFSMAAGSFLTEHSAEGYINQEEPPFGRAIIGGIVMFFSYFISGFVPLLPYLFTSPALALSYSVTLSLIALLVLGFVSGYIAHMNRARHALRMALIGGLAIALGIFVGTIIA